jgi:hypothetical protein
VKNISNKLYIEKKETHFVFSALLRNLDLLERMKLKEKYISAHVPKDERLVLLLLITFVTSLPGSTLEYHEASEVAFDIGKTGKLFRK